MLEILEKRAEAHKIEFKLNKSDYVAQVLGLKIVFLSMENKADYEKARSMTDIDFIWMNEATEMRALDYDMLRMIIRGGESSFSQMITDFNPIGKTSWLYKRFFENRNGSNGVHKIHYTVFDNPWAKEQEIDILKSYEHINKNLYDINFLGQWGELEGVIYDWGEPVDVESMPESLDETFYGLDFGYSVDPAALIRIYRKADEFWVEEVIYEKGLTNQALAQRMRDKGVNESADIYADSAEPKSIDEIHHEGFNVKPCEKGKDSVKAGIDYLQSLKIHIIDGSENISKEQRSYVRKQDKNGEYLPEPVDFENHAMDAIRYGIYAHCKKKLGGFGVM